MVLSTEQAREIIRKPQYAAAVKEAQDHEARLKFHGKAVDTKAKASSYYKRFLRWVEKDIGLHHEKYDAFVGMLQFPLPTTSLIDDIFKEYKRIFTANDAVRQITMQDSGMREEFEGYVEATGLHEYLVDEGLRIMQTQPGCIFVVDMPQVQTGARPEPYFYQVPLSSVIDLQTDGKRIGYVVFKVGADQFVVLDDSSYRLFQRIDDNDVLMAEAPHTLGYCPATFFLCDPLYTQEDNSPIARKSPISPQAANLDWLLFFKVGERMYESFGVFPITTVPESACSFVDPVTQHACKGGKVATIRDNVTEYYDCPSCQGNNLIGPGTIFTKPVPKNRDQPELMEPVIITPADVESLKHVKEKLDFIEWEIYESCVGSNDDQVTKEAVNEKQVQSNAEGKRNTLIDVKRHLERTESFIIETMGRLMYGPYFVSCYVNYGETFMLYTESDLTMQYTEVKKAGLPMYMVADKQAMLMQHSAGNDENKARRLKILHELEPWTSLSLMDVSTMQLGALYPEKFLLKIDFAKFVSKFEIEEGDIVEWGSEMEYATKIEAIKTKLLEYVRAERSTAEALPAETGAEGSRGTGARA